MYTIFENKAPKEYNFVTISCSLELWVDGVLSAAKTSFSTQIPHNQKKQIWPINKANAP